MKELRIIPFGANEYTIYISENSKKNKIVYGNIKDLRNINYYNTYPIEEFLSHNSYKHNKDKITKILKEKDMWEYLI